MPNVIEDIFNLLFWMQPGKPLHAFMVTPSKEQKKTLRMLVLVLPFPPPHSPLPLILLPFLAFLAARQSLIKSRKKGGEKEREALSEEEEEKREEKRLTLGGWKGGRGKEQTMMECRGVLSCPPRLFCGGTKILGEFSLLQRGGWEKEMNSFALCRLSPFKAAVAEAKRNLSLCCCIKMRLFNRSSGGHFFLGGFLSRFVRMCRFRRSVSLSPLFRFFFAATVKGSNSR